MNHESSGSLGDFDQYASTYDADLAKGISISGEDKNYFARCRVEWLRQLLNGELSAPATLEFGCGAGSNIPFLVDALGARSVLGLDISTRSLEVARRACRSEQVQFLKTNKYEPSGELDLV